MEANTIVEGNKLIAEFIGISDFTLNEFDKFLVTDNNKVIGYFSYEDLKYHTSWDWLMPVVEKIEVEQGCIIEIWLSLGKGCRINRLQPKGSNPITIPFSYESNSTIEAVWHTVVQFIKWYNQQQSSK